MRHVITGPNGVITNNSKAFYYKDDSLPDGLTGLQYIVASGKSAINTNVIVESTDKIIITFSLSSLSSRGDKFILSGQLGYTGGGIWVETYDPNNTWYVRFGSAASVNKSINSKILTGIHTLELRKQYFGVDDSQILTPDYTGMYNGPLDIGGRLNYTETSVTGFYGNIYNTEIIASDGSYKWHGVPAKNVNNVAGLYDHVSDKFFVCPTENAFVAGPILQ